MLKTTNNILLNQAPLLFHFVPSACIENFDRHLNQSELLDSAVSKKLLSKLFSLNIIFKSR